MSKKVVGSRGKGFHHEANSYCSRRKRKRQENVFPAHNILHNKKT